MLLPLFFQTYSAISTKHDHANEPANGLPHLHFTLRSLGSPRFITYRGRVSSSVRD